MNTKRLYVVCALFVFLSCRKSAVFPDIQVVGHAGSGLHVERSPFPSNTQASLDFASSLGAKHVEVDLHLSKDNHWILFHDDVLEMRTNFSGCVRDFLKSDFEDAFYLGFHKYKVQALSDIDFSQFEMVFLDIRHYDACSNFALLDTAHMHHDILETVNRFPNQRFIILSRSAHVLNHFRSLNFDICHEVIDFKSVEISAKSFGFNFFALRNKAISDSEISTAQLSGWQILLFDVKSLVGNRSAMEKSPNFVMTDALLSAIELTK